MNQQKSKDKLKAQPGSLQRLVGNPNFILKIYGPSLSAKPADGRLFMLEHNHVPTNLSCINVREVFRSNLNRNLNRNLRLGVRVRLRLRKSH